MENHLNIATRVANLLDNQFNIFGIRFGLNGLLGLIPGAGDLIVAVLSFYIVWIGIKMRLPVSALSEMVGNIIANFLIGLLPIIGDAVDFFNHANLKNLKILKHHATQGVVEGQIIDITKHISYR
jgi:hypothetical protein